MFNQADSIGGFKLFFSFDHGAGYLTGNPNQYADFFTWFNGRPSYFNFADRKTGKVKPLLSTFGGERVPDSQWAEFKRKVGDVLIVPGFYDDSILPASTSFFNNRGSLDGLFNWNSWPKTQAGRVRVSSADDTTFQTAAHNTDRIFMMGISPIQSKHLDAGQNWYRRGEDNLEYRLDQALALQPDIIQLQSWNDAGESHYMGNLWPEPLNDRTKELTDAYPHRAYNQIIPAFVQAWKRGDTSTANMFPTNGKSVQGVFWHHTLTIDGSCSGDDVIKSPDPPKVAEDAVTGVVLVKSGKTGLVAVVNVGGKELGKMNLVPGFNRFKYTGMGTGKVEVEVWEGSTLVMGGYGALEVQRQAAICNYNFQVVGLGV
jgi:glucan endo-1,3-alpha-glucosidase